MTRSSRARQVTHPAHEQPARLLLVDDRPENLLALEAVLAPLGHEIHPASSARDALRLALAHDFAVILLDVQMPGIDGFETARLLKERKSSALTPIIFLTASNTDPRDQFTGYAAGAVDYIAKPFDPELIRAKVEVFVELYRARELHRKEHAALVAEQVARTSAERARKRMEHLVEGLGDAFLGVDANHRITYANSKAEQLLAAPRHALLGMRVSAALQRTNPGMGVEELQRVLDTGNSGCVELVFDAPHRIYDVTVYASPSERSVFLRDVTAQRTAEDGLRSAEERLQKANRMETVGQFAGSIAHDFNNILTIIGTSADFLAQELKAGTEAANDLKEIRSAVHRGAALVKQLMQFSRGGDSTGVSDVNYVLAEFEPLLRRLVGSAIRVSVVEGDSVPPVRLAPTMVEQILMNLAANARDAMQPGGKLTIRTSRVTRDSGRDGLARTFAEISVTDTGSGMDEAMRGKVFEAYFTTKEPSGGTGLGLATVRGIVEQAGGSIEVDSVIGGGTTFRIYLPAFDTQPASDEPDGELRFRAGGRSRDRGERKKIA